MASNTERPINIALFAGERSGDHCGAGLMRALKKLAPQCHFEGVPGPGMRAEGCKVLQPMEAFTVMGILRILCALPRLYFLRRKLLKHWRRCPPDLFIGIDFPDFNFGLERQLKKMGIKTLHYVSPTVWAWRAGRLKHIAQSTDLMLTLFPFEVRYYEQANIPARFVGHPLAERYPLHPDKAQARAQLNLHNTEKVIALLPGSRNQEITDLAQIFIETAKWCWQKQPELTFLMPLASNEHIQRVKSWIADTQVPIRLLLGHADKVLIAADAALIASGTATLEGLMAKTPMVVAYRLPKLTFWLAKKLVRTPYVALPNILAGKALVPEFLQDAVTPEVMGPELLSLLENNKAQADLQQTFLAIHQGLQQDANAQAAKAVMDMLPAQSRLR